MTTFSYPVLIKRAEEGLNVGSTVAGQLAAVVRANARPVWSVKVSVGQTGVAVGGTTIPLFIAPAGTRFFDATVDVLTAFDSTAGVSVQVGTPALPANIVPQTAINSTGRKAVTQTAATVSTNAIPLTVDTTIKATVSITTSVITAGEMIIHVIGY